MPTPFHSLVVLQVNLHARKDRTSNTLESHVSWRQFMPPDIAIVGAHQTFDAQLYQHGLVLSRLDNLVWQAAAALGLHPVELVPLHSDGEDSTGRKHVCGYQGIAEQA